MEKGFFAKAICQECSDALKARTYEPVCAVAIIEDCDLCGKQDMVQDTRVLKKRCIRCGELVSLSGWSFTPKKKEPRPYCETCRKDMLYIKRPTDGRKER